MRLDFLQFGILIVALGLWSLGPGSDAKLRAQGPVIADRMSLESQFTRVPPALVPVDQTSASDPFPGLLSPFDNEPIDLAQNLEQLDSGTYSGDGPNIGSKSGGESSVLENGASDKNVMSAEARAGSSLYYQKCARCHQLYSPSDFSASEWPGLVRSMKQEAGLSESEASMITAYLTSATTGAGEGKKPTSGAVAPRVGGYLYSEFFRTELKQKNWDIHYLNLSVDGWANEKIHYFGEFELEHGGKNDNTFVEQAYIDYWFCELFAVKIGAILTPFNRFDDFHSPLGNYAITRPQVSREIAVSAWKDVGINLHGFHSFGELTVKYDAYWINGLGDGVNLRSSRQYRDNNEEMAVGGRLSLVFFDEIEWGGSVYSGDWDDQMTLNLTMAGTHFLWSNEWVDIYGEYANARSENPTGTDDGSMNGYFIQASTAFFCDQIRTTARYGKLDYLDPGTALGRDAAKGNKDVRELLFVLGYYPTPNVVFKFEYTIFNEGARVASVDNNQFGFQAAVRW